MVALAVLMGKYIGCLRGSRYSSVTRSPLNRLIGHSMLGLLRVDARHIYVGRGGYNARR